MSDGPMEPSAPSRPCRVPGGWERKVWVADDFDDSLPPDMLGAFGGGGAA